MELTPDRANSSRSHSAWVLIAVILATMVTACSTHETGRAVVAAPPLALRASDSQAKSTLSREHTVVIDIPESPLETGFRRVSDRCASDTAHHCTILQSDLSSGDAPSGLIKLRIDPEAVESLIGLAAAQGKLERRCIWCGFCGGGEEGESGRW